MRPLELSDAPFLVNLFNSPTWLQFIGDRGVRTIADAEEFLQNKALKFFKEKGWGTYLIVLKEGEIPIGTVGLYEREELDQPDFGFALMPDYQGKGLGTESTRAMLDEVLDSLDLPLIYAIVQEDNAPSRALLDSLGFRFKEMTTIAPNDLMLYALQV